MAAADITAEDVCRTQFHPTRQVCEANGLTLERLVKELKRELKAKTTKFFAHEGVVVDQRDFIDWGTRQRARMDAHKLRGDYPAEKQAVEHSGNLTHDFGEVSASVAAAIARLKAKEDKGE